MKHSISLFLVVAAFLGVGLVSVHGDEPQKKPKADPPSLLQKLSSQNLEEKISAASAVRIERRKTIASLLLLLQTSEKLDFNSPKEMAIRLLGEIRAQEAVPLLVNQVALRVPIVRTEFIPLQEYPVIETFIRIGNPSIEGIFKSLQKQEKADREMMIYAYIIRAVDGDEVGRFRIESKLQGAIGNYKLNLLNLRDFYKLNLNELDLLTKLNT